MVLLDGTHHSVNLDEPEKYEEGTFEQTTLVIDPESVFPRTGPMKGYTEMTIAELKVEMAELRKQNIYPHNQIMAWQKKYSIPAACLAFMLVALGMGVSHRRDGRLAAFVLGIGVVFVYWVLMYMSEAIAKAGLLPYWFAWLAMWVPNIVIALWGLVLIVEKAAGARAVVHEVCAAVRAAPRARRAAAGRDAASGERDARRGRGQDPAHRVSAAEHPRLVCAEAGAARVGARGRRTARRCSTSRASSICRTICSRGGRPAFTVLTYLWWASPQFTYYLVPLAVLMGALVTIGALTKNTELVVMKACGISLYRAAAPLLILALIGSAILVGLEEGVLARVQSARRCHQQRDSRAISDDRPI